MKKQHAERKLGRKVLRIGLISLGSFVSAVLLAFGGWLGFNAISISDQNKDLAGGVKLDAPLPTRPGPVGPAPLNGATTRGGFTVSGPVIGGEHGTPFGAYYGDISKVGYVEDEYFVSGLAQQYDPVGELAKDGKWTLSSGATSPYETRILVRRPVDPAKFNGTVIVEWANVSSGYEVSFADPPGMYDNGFAYVSVSAQPLGLDGYEPDSQGLKAWDPARYGNLHIADDGLSYDIYTQAARAVGPDRSSLKEGTDPMGGLAVKKLIAVGGSQSGNRLIAYADGVQPKENVFDAIIPMLTAGRAADFSSALAHADKTKHSRAIPAMIRSDLTVPVLAINTTTEAAVYFDLRQPDSNVFRSWEIAGSAHAPVGQMVLIHQKTDRDGVTDTENDPPSSSSRVDWLYTLDAAYVQVNDWIDGTSTPPRFKPLEVSALKLTYKNDKNGNALGGIRLPEITVPTARYDVTPLGGLTGKTIPFSEDKLKQLYPTHQDYVDKVTAAAQKAEREGVILPYRVQQYVQQAEESDIP